MPAMNQPTTILQGIFLQFMSIYQYFGPTCTVTKNRQRAGFIAGLLVVITEARPRSKMLALSLRQRTNVPVWHVHEHEMERYVL